MTAGGPGPSSRARWTWGVAFLLPPALWLGFAAAGRLVARTPDGPADPSRFLSAFHERLTEADRVARSALDVSPERAADLARVAGPDWRLEGVGVVETDGTYIDWVGTPAEAEPAAMLRPEAPRWLLRRDGARTRLIVRAGPNRIGLSAIATFVVDSDRGGGAAHLAAGTGGRWPTLRYLDTAALYADDLADPEARVRITALRLPDPATGRVALISPGGDLLGLLVVDSPAPAGRARRLERAGQAAGAALLAVLLAGFARRPGAGRSALTVLVGLGCLGLARLLLIVLDAPARLLPRALGSPSLYGSSSLGGLLGSPADLLLTALGLMLAARILRDRVRGIHSPSLAATLAIGGAASATAAVLGLALSLARDSRLPVLRFDVWRDAPVSVMLLAGWVLALLAAAELWAASVARLVPERLAPRIGSAAGAMVAVVPLSLAAALLLQGTGDELRLQRLRDEFAPQVLDPGAPRRVALLSAVREAAESLRSPPEASSNPASAAFALWTTGDLFHSGYRSSLDLYDPSGRTVSSFGFDLPPIEDPPAGDEVRPGEPVVREETITVGALTRRVLHADLPVVRDGAPAGFVVGHVLDEPSNLPFVAAATPYLDALGPDGPYPTGEGSEELPEYVLYDRRGTVLLRTLDRPPTLTRELELAATRRRTVELETGGDRWAGLPLLDGDRLHLLLVPDRTLLERLGGAVRLGLAAWAMLLLLSLPGVLFRRGSTGRIADTVLGSFYRKLLATLLIASVVPLVGLALFVRGYIAGRADDALMRAAVQYVLVAQRVVEDFLVATEDPENGEATLDDEMLHWLRRLVEQEIHVYRDGRLEASSKRELFTSGLLAARLPGRVQEEMVRGGLPYFVLRSRIGETTLPVAYAPLRSSDTAGSRVVAVPLTIGNLELARTVDRVDEVLLLATVALAGLLAAIAAALARSVASPVRELVGASGRIAAGDYRARLHPRTRDELADLVESFNGMAASLAAQRADLERRRDYMEALLRNATTGVASTDAGGSIVTVNPAMAALLGLPHDALSPGGRLDGALRSQKELAPLAAALAEPREAWIDPREVDVQHGGEQRRFRAVRVDLPDPSGGAPGSLILLDDVTDLMRANRLSAWAEMARAIAHEIKNPLTPIQLSTEHLRRVLRDRGVLPSDDVDSCLATVMKQVEALRQIAGEFSTYARLPELAPKPRDPVAFAREVVGPYRSARPENVEIDERYLPCPEVRIDGRVLGRACINLIENALQAMPDGGRLTIRVAPAEGDGDGTVELSVADTGTGLDEDVRARLFEPYFSTKSSGTGLGLAIVQRAVEAHGGRIEVDSEPGRGTTFRIHLPALGASTRPSSA